MPLVGAPLVGALTTQIPTRGINLGTHKGCPYNPDAPTGGEHW